MLVYARRKDTANHAAYREWLEGVVNGDEAYGISDLVLSCFVRVVTHPKVFKRPSRAADAFAFAEQLASSRIAYASNPVRVIGTSSGGRASVRA